MTPIFFGVATALITPFKQKKVDFPTLVKLINRQISDHADALVILGTTGEMPTLSTAERQAIIDCALKTNHDQIPLIFGIGGNDPARIIELGRYVANRSKELNCRKIGIMVTAPYYNKTTPAGMVTYFRYITNTLKLPTIIYNIPTRTGVNIAPETMAEISALRYVAGIKEASGNISQIIQTVKLCPKTAVYCGDDTIALATYAIGCRGVISVASNLDVAPVKKIYTAYQAGDIRTALTLFHEQHALYQSLFRAVNPIPIKAEMAKLGLIKNELRLPLLPE